MKCWQVSGEIEIHALLLKMQNDVATVEDSLISGRPAGGLKRYVGTLFKFCSVFLYT